MGEKPPHRTLFSREPDPFSRREFLDQAFITGMGMAAIKFDSYTANCGMPDCEKRPELNLTPKQRKLMLAPSAPIRTITNSNMDAKMFPYTIRFQKSMGYQVGGLTTREDEINNRGIQVFLPDLRPNTLEIGAHLLYHEEVHILSFYNHMSPVDHVRDRIVQITGTDRLNDGLYSLVTESAYSTNPLLYGIGHPWDSTFELLASMMTILRFYPDKFIARVNRLRSDRDRATIMQVASAGIEGVLSCSDTPLSAAALQLDPRLIAFLVS